MPHKVRSTLRVLFLIYSLPYEIGIWLPSLYLYNLLRDPTENIWLLLVTPIHYLPVSTFLKDNQISVLSWISPFPQPELHLLFIFPPQIWRIPPPPDPHPLFPELLPIHFSHLFQRLWLLRLLMWAPKSSTFLSPRTLYLIVVKLPSVANLPFHL